MATPVTHTLEVSGGDYTLISTWESTEQRSLTGADETETLECYDDWASGLNDRTTIDGWTVDATRFVTIKAAAGAEATALDVGFRLAYNTGNNSGTISINDNYVRLEHIGLEANSSSSNAALYIGAPGSNSTIDGCVLVSRTTGSGRCFRNPSVTTTVLVKNCLMVAFGTNYCAFLIGSSDFVFYNNTIICTSSGTAVSGVTSSADGLYINNVAFSSSGTDWATIFTNGSNDSNVGSGTNAPGTNALDSIASTVFNNYAGEDFSPDPGGDLDGANNEGQDLSGSFTVDITDLTRDDPWERGAYELEASVGGRIMSSLANHGGLAGHGGIAGPAGGLAG